jgi:predicted pyridoxine 5'-phosphate oxidase superfamily flavin-nucleotide-binding protein
VSHAFAEIAFTPAVKAAQVRDGSRAQYARAFERDDGTVSHRELGPDEAAFLADQRSLVLATVSETGWPYVQHRGGPKGFVKVLDSGRIAFADFAGNRQLVSVGNVGAGNDRVALLLIDHAHRVRLKILGRLSVVDFDVRDPAHAALLEPGYAARPQRVFTIAVEAFDWNCPQHIPVRIDAEDVQRALDERDARIAALQARLRELEAAPR